MSRVPAANNSVSLASFQEGVKWMAAVAHATLEVSGPDQYTIVQGNNDFAAIESQIDRKLLNALIDDCYWIPKHDLDSSKGAFDSIITCTAYHDTAWADSGSGIHADYRCNGGVNVDSAGHTIDLTQTEPYKEIASTLAEMKK